MVVGDLVTCRREDHPRPRQRGAGPPPWSLRSELGAALPVECRQASPPADKADRRERPQYHLETGKGRARAGRGKDRGLNQGAGAADRQLRSHESARPSRIQPEKVAKSAHWRAALRATPARSCVRSAAHGPGGGLSGAVHRARKRKRETHLTTASTVSSPAPDRDLTFAGLAVFVCRAHDPDERMNQSKFVDLRGTSPPHFQV